MSFKYFFQQIPLRLCLLIIYLYQWLISPLLGSSCRFFPSCSHYAAQALKSHGFLMGCWLSIKRMGKCGPWHPGGIDLVPKTTLEEALEPCQERDGCESIHFSE
ncbi:membrane protein insertion efficiency factor YidD [Candidatus Chlamydia corallus]|uniref:membrane protein insertion efficiency factor YidD n=1 Tax=Candidatus Chlamydia corallus TaxID=2038470 RepID=UPI000C2FAE06|nr:membrane protein insertion efficiency factor YidD [Candidatus Chlamydia corallus]